MRRLGVNTGWMLGGRGLSGLISLAYLAFAARALGPRRFGEFSLVLSFAGALAAFATFQTSQAVIRFGSVHLATGRADRVARLVGAMALLDAITGMLGAAAVFAVAPLAGHFLGWTASDQSAAAVFSAVLMISSGSAPSGMLRLHNRFDLLAAAETVGPALRLIGASALWLSGGGVHAFLVAWAVAVAGEAVASWSAALLAGRPRPTANVHSLGRVPAENPGVVAFLVHNNLMNSLAPVWAHAGVLAVGTAVGSTQAGGYRLAAKLAGAMGKPVESIARALFPEVARLAASGDGTRLGSLLRNATLAALAAAGLAVGVAALFGADLLDLLYGRAYVFAAPALLLLAVAAAVDVTGVAVEPALNAHGLSGPLLAAHAFGATLLLAALALLVPHHGMAGAGVAAVIAAVGLRAITAALAISMFAGRGS